MTGEVEVLVSEGDWATVYHQPLGASNFPQCGRNAQQDVGFKRVPRSEVKEEYDRCQRCSFTDFDANEDNRLVADGGYARPPKTTVHGEGETIAIGVEHGDISVVVQAPCDVAGHDLDEALEAAVQEAHHYLSVHPKSNVSERTARDGDLLPDGGFDARTEPGQFDVDDELNLVTSPKADLIGARISGVADYRGQPHSTRIANDEIVQIRTDKEGRRVFLTRPVREDGTLEGRVREVPLRVFDCDRLEPSGGEQ